MNGFFEIINVCFIKSSPISYSAIFCQRIDICFNNYVIVFEKNFLHPEDDHIHDLVFDQTGLTSPQSFLCKYTLYVLVWGYLLIIFGIFAVARYSLLCELWCLVLLGSWIIPLCLFNQCLFLILRNLCSRSSILSCFWRVLWLFRIVSIKHLVCDRIPRPLFLWDLKTLNLTLLYGYGYQPENKIIYQT